MRTIIRGARIYTGEAVVDGCDLVVEGDAVAAIEPQGAGGGAGVVDARGCVVVPGVIDTHVHFRQPGMTEAADIRSESRAAAAGGVTTYFDMPNNSPATTTLAAMDAKRATARRDSAVNYSFYLGATHDNLGEIKAIDPRRVCGVKVFMGSSTGNMLVEGGDVLRRIFAESPVPVVAHCEDMATINRRAEEVMSREGKDAGVEWHPYIRNAESCYKSSSLAVEIARETGAQLHVAHISTARELSLFTPGDTQVTAEACIPHLVFCDEDYARLGAMIKCNPAIKTAADREALRQALRDGGRIYSVATDHAPHLPSRKRGGAFTAASGMPGVQFSLINMLELCEEGYLGIEQAVRLMSARPAALFKIERRGMLREGNFADFAILRHCGKYTLKESEIVSKCGWSPYTGREYSWRVEATYSNGRRVYSRTEGLDPGAHGQEITFCR